jgi:hypothetical protein
MIRPLLLLALLPLAACGPRVLTLDGTESPAAGATPRLALARVTQPETTAPQLELRTADGAVRNGQLGLLPPEEAPPSPGGGIPLALRDDARILAGRVEAPGSAPYDCRFRILNPARGMGGGGAGGCVTADGTRIDFIY